MRKMHGQTTLKKHMNVVTHEASLCRIARELLWAKDSTLVISTV
jgi:hypothetical protein